MRGWLSMTAVAFGLAAGVALPTSAQAADGATISKDFGCGGFVPTPSGGIGAALVTFETASVVSGSGSTTLTCHFDIPAGLEPAKTTRAAGFPCYTYLFELTHDTRMQANSGGNATLSCRIRTRN